MDGFVSVHAPYDGGELLTKPFRFSGEQLVLNFESSAAGEIRIELRDAAGEPIEGFTVADCALIFGNEIDGEVNWTGGRDLSELAGQEVQMRIEMKDADLYSFQFR